MSEEGQEKIHKFQRFGNWAQIVAAVGAILFGGGSVWVGYNSRSISNNILKTSELTQKRELVAEAFEINRHSQVELDKSNARDCFLMISQLSSEGMEEIFDFSKRPHFVSEKGARILFEKILLADSPSKILLEDSPSLLDKDADLSTEKFIRAVNDCVLIDGSGSAPQDRNTLYNEFGATPEAVANVQRNISEKLTNFHNALDHELNSYRLLLSNVCDVHADSSKQNKASACDAKFSTSSYKLEASLLIERHVRNERSFLCKGNLKKAFKKLNELNECKDEETRKNCIFYPEEKNNIGTFIASDCNLNMKEYCKKFGEDMQDYKTTGNIRKL